jgi:hypothetical protein
MKDGRKNASLVAPRRRCRLAFTAIFFFICELGPDGSTASYPVSTVMAPPPVTGLYGDFPPHLQPHLPQPLLGGQWLRLPPPPLLRRRLTGAAAPSTPTTTPMGPRHLGSDSPASMAPSPVEWRRSLASAHGVAAMAEAVLTHAPCPAGIFSLLGIQ